MNKKIAISIILIFTFYQGMFCQTFDKLLGIIHAPGIVVMKSKDTIKGIIDFSDDYGYYKMVHIKDTLKNLKREFTPEQCEYYMFDNHKFLPKYCKHEWFFMELLINGYLKLYRFRFFDGYNDNSMFVLEKPSTEMQLVSDFRLWNFSKHVSKFLIDCPEISQKIKIKEYKYNDLFRIVNEYNLLMTKK